MENELILQPVRTEKLDSTPSKRRYRKFRDGNPYEQIKGLDRFYAWWNLYTDYCKLRCCNYGDRKGAAIAWLELESAGVDMSLVIKSTEWDIANRKQARNNTWLPYARRYLKGGGLEHPTPYWEVALEQMNEREAVVTLTAETTAANHEWQGLKFRSGSEVKIAMALDKAGVLFFPNARARLGTSDNRFNREPDFLICDNGRWGILEVDGELWHQIAAKDHNRDRAFMAHGINFIQRYDSKECYNNADVVVLSFLSLMDKFYSRTN